LGGEVDVDVGEAAAVLVEEALEAEVVGDGVDQRDPERVGGAAAAGAAPPSPTFSGVLVGTGLGSHSHGGRPSVERSHRTMSSTIRK
jgi:hypothetical protein